jgi:hypothetical protein
VQLGTVFWDFQPVSDGTVLVADGDAVFSSTGQCPPGVGCGTSTQRYRALSAGTATVTATRTNCGEALVCTPDQASYSVTVIVDP